MSHQRKRRQTKPTSARRASRRPRPLKYAETKLRALVEAAPDAIICVDREGRMIFVNGQTGKMFGYGRAELLGEPVEMLVPERFRDRHVAHRADYCSRPRTRPMGVFNLWGRRKDGTDIPVEIALSPVVTGEELAIIAIVRDITERKEAEKSLLAAKEKLEEQKVELERASKVKDEFLSVMSHELRTPLNVVVGYAGMLKDGLLGDLSPRQQQALEKVIYRTNDQLVMVNNLLFASVLDAERAKVDTHNLALADFLAQLRSAYEPPINKPVTLNWDYPDHLPLIKTDANKLRHILQNLINNAIKFTDQGTITISARILYDATDGRQHKDPTARASRLPSHTSDKWLEFKVADTGIGISQEMLPAVFDKFRQVDGSETRSFGGVGLGLYIVKKFIDLLGGTVEVGSELGKGSTFTVTLPVEQQ